MSSKSSGGRSSSSMSAPPPAVLAPAVLRRRLPCTRSNLLRVTGTVLNIHDHSQYLSMQTGLTIAPGLQLPRNSMKSHTLLHSPARLAGLSACRPRLLLSHPATTHLSALKT
jgi:hypothetical protein